MVWGSKGKAGSSQEDEKKQIFGKQMFAWLFRNSGTENSNRLHKVIPCLHLVSIKLQFPMLIPPCLEQVLDLDSFRQLRGKNKNFLSPLFFPE